MNDNYLFFTIIQEELNEGHDLVLAVVTESFGSTPRGVGAKMLVNESGRIFGTV